MAAGLVPSEHYERICFHKPLLASASLLAIFSISQFAEASPQSLPLSSQGMSSVPTFANQTSFPLVEGKNACLKVEFFEWDMKAHIEI